jgi:hypothetical protein
MVGSYKRSLIGLLAAYLLVGPAFVSGPALVFCPGAAALTQADNSPLPDSQPPARQLTLPQAAISDAAKTKNILSPVGRDIAEQIGVVNLINEIVDVHAQLKDNPSLALKYIELKQKLMQTVLINSLQVRDATARIDREVASLNRLNGVLGDARDRAIRTNSITNIFGTGAIQEIGQAGEMKTNEIPGEITELVGGGLIVALGGLSLYQQRGGARPMHSKANMLAQVLGCQADRDTLYPAVVWSYLNRAPAGSASIKTRLQVLIEQWQAYKTIGSLKDPRSRKRLASLSNTLPNCRATLNLIGDRMDMLNDVKAEIFQMDRDLLELLLNVQSL